MSMKLTRTFQVFFVLGCFFAIFSVFYTRGLGSFFWDLSTYLRAIKEFSLGENPYNQDATLLFVYHPLVLWFFYFLNELISIKILFFASLTISFVFFTRQIRLLLFSTSQNQSVISIKVFLILLLGTLSFGGAGLVAILTGNITVILHFIILGVLLRFIRIKSRSSFYHFYFLIVLFSIVKPYLLSYLLILFNFEGFKRVATYILSATFIFSILWFSSALLEPSIYNQFLNALNYQTSNQGDLGYSLFGLLTPLLGSSLSLVFHIFIMTFIFLILFRKATSSYQNKNNSLLPLIYIVLIIFINPRMKEYDYFVSVLFTLILIHHYCGEEYIKRFILGLIISITPYLIKLLQKLEISSMFKYDYEYFYVFHILALVVIFPYKILSKNKEIQNE